MIDIDELSDEQPEDSKKKNIQNKRDHLVNLLDGLQEFDATQYIANSDDLPAREVVHKDFDKEYENLNKQSDEIIDVICKNYITSDKVYAHNKVTVIRNEQRSKLSDLQFLVDISRKTLQQIVEAVDSGDLEQAHNLQSYMQELRTNLDAKQKHLDAVEKYWELLSMKLGTESTGESSALENDTDNKQTDSKKTKDNIMSQEQLNDMIDKAMRESKDTKDKRKNK